MGSSGSHINGQAVIIEVKQPGSDIVKFTPVGVFAVTEDHKGKAVIAHIKISPDLRTVGGIKIYNLLSLHPARGAENEEEEDIYSHKTGGLYYITICW
jgi:hypothetical protein